jgi:predicted transcriptional regulator
LAVSDAVPLGFCPTKNVAIGAICMSTFFRNHFRVLRRAAGLSQTELARRLGTTRQRLSRWEQSKIDLTPCEERGIDQLVVELSAEARCAAPAYKRCWEL